MPALLPHPSSSSPSHLYHHTPSLVHRSLNATEGLRVVCAWPVSGQYGPGTRFLYYVLILACVFGRKAGWVRKACLAAALVFPAVAALHGVVLAAVHRDGAVDMDVYGAFQLCSIGVLVALVTAKTSRTYFYDLGRDIIFAWTAIILAGLLSLTVEFYRSHARICTQDDSGEPITLQEFVYGNTTCNLICSVDQGPFSPIRGGSGNNIYVIPIPSDLTFNTATLLSAGCCIPAILLLVSMFNKIRLINYKKSRDESRAGLADSQSNEGPGSETSETSTSSGESASNETISRDEGPVNGEKQKSKRATAFNNFGVWVREYPELPVFGAAVIAILIVGEKNFFSHQVTYMKEPMPNVGQWAPIVGTGLGLLGSLYLLLAKAMREESAAMKEAAATSAAAGSPGPAETDIITHDSHSHNEKPSLSSKLVSSPSPSRIESRSSPPPSPSPPLLTQSQQAKPTLHDCNCPHCDRKGDPDASEENQAATSGWPHLAIRGTARLLLRIALYVGNPAKGLMNDEEFERGRDIYPTVPGEKERNPNLHRIASGYSRRRDTSMDGRLEAGEAEIARSRSRGPSSAGSFSSSSSPQRKSFHREFSSSSGGAKGQWQGQAQGHVRHASLPSGSGPKVKPRRSTLDVPGSFPALQQQSSRRRGESLAGGGGGGGIGNVGPVIARMESEDAPAIIVSHDDDDNHPADPAEYQQEHDKEGNARAGAEVGQTERFPPLSPLPSEPGSLVDETRLGSEMSRPYSG